MSQFAESEMTPEEFDVRLAVGEPVELNVQFGENPGKQEAPTDIIQTHTLQVATLPIANSV